MEIPKKCRACIEPEENITYGPCKKSICEKYKGMFRGNEDTPKWWKE